jgi:hypothetical protein
MEPFVAWSERGFGVRSISREMGRELYKQEHNRDPTEEELTKYLEEMERKARKGESDDDDDDDGDDQAAAARATFRSVMHRAPRNRAELERVTATQAKKSQARIIKAMVAGGNARRERGL